MGGTTMTILGCGNMGTAILDGILTTLKEGTRTKNKLPLTALPSRFIACVNRPESIAPLENKYKEYVDHGTPSIEVWQNSNDKAVKAADIILLACQPSQAAKILSNPGLRANLQSKLLLSICVGLSVSKIQGLINGDAESMVQGEGPHIVHAMPNTASGVRESATIISTAGSPLPADMEALAMWVFESIGTVTKVREHEMNAASVTAASTPAFFAEALEGIVQGAMKAGLDRQVALRMAAQSMKGTAEMILRGDDPPTVQERVMTPNGCTERGVRVLRAGSVESVYTDAIQQAIHRVFELGREPKAN
ncbi:pyrroline-5-carboxylate reductase [Patellaria atrata CBS 101060]|uniref:Pyrroline-5-carboxylate reductase n=1 Tax=Patellaria atrata CBS 101060 TaxID=1346257 RepID=A0A9P4SBV8_9PEZI|nr:pyrroline-5-carboxylate reductase [Patellaria atrata CBS 101060]